ncbi:MAG TPA: hypothetical protein VK387_06660 [Thermoleophilaceae bacterium]|nr:hypothetical protein [Thermoleophilaceae bacterium]
MPLGGLEVTALFHWLREVLVSARFEASEVNAMRSQRPSTETS